MAVDNFGSTPIPGSALVGAGAAEHVPELDFNGTPRAGAYRFQSGGNPGWALAPGFKGSGTQVARPNPPTDVTATSAP